MKIVTSELTGEFNQLNMLGNYYDSSGSESEEDDTLKNIKSNADKNEKVDADEKAKSDAKTAKDAGKDKKEESSSEEEDSDDESAKPKGLPSANFDLPDKITNPDYEEPVDQEARLFQVKLTDNLNAVPPPDVRLTMKNEHAFGKAASERAGFKGAMSALKGSKAMAMIPPQVRSGRPNAVTEDTSDMVKRPRHR